jgi:hypothetical protein
MKNTIILVISLLICSVSFALQTANSLPVSGSYLLRAQGTEALYWNPASINPEYQDIIIPGFNFAIGLANSAFDLDTYNYISGRQLTNADKSMLMDKIGKGLRVNTDIHLLLLGMTFGNIALSTSTNEYSKIRLSKDYLKIVLYGNSNTDYEFSKQENQANALVYQDITLGMGNFEVTKYIQNPLFPKIFAGASISGLIGGGVAETDKYTGVFHSDFDGMYLKQDIYARTGIVGVGAKALISLKSEPISNLKVGFSLDNIGGYIKWVGDKKRYHYSVESDSVYASDMGDDFVTDLDSTWALTKDFATKLPMEMRLGALYQYRNANISMDYIQGYDSSIVTSSIGAFCFAVEYAPTPLVPIQIGYKPGNSDVPWSTSYGLGLRGKSISWGLGIQTYKSLLPGYYSTGVSLSSNFTIHY